MAVQFKSLGGRDMPKDQVGSVRELLESKTAAASGGSMGGAICISSLPLDMRTRRCLDPSPDLPAIVPPACLASISQASASQPRSADQLHSLFTLFSYYKPAAPLLADQHYLCSQLTSPEAAVDIMPGPLRERDLNVHTSRRSSIQFLDNFQPKSYLSHQRLPEHCALSADESEENTGPRFMTSTAASASRSITSSTPASDQPKPRRTPTPHTILTLAAFSSKQHSDEVTDDVASSAKDATRNPATPADCPSLPTAQPFPQASFAKPAVDKPLPSRPVAHVVSNSPYKEGRTLIDASEKPLRRSLGTPDEEDWPTLPLTQATTSDTLQVFTPSHPVPPSPNQSLTPSRIPMESTLNRTPASPGKQRPTIKMVAQRSSENILPSSDQAEKISTPPPSTSVIQNAKSFVDRPASSPKSFNPKENSAGHTSVSSLPQPRPRLVDIPSPKSRQGRRPPVTNSGAIPRPRGIPRPNGLAQANNTNQAYHQPHSDHPRGYSRMDAPMSGSPEYRPVTGGMGLPRSPKSHHGVVPPKKSAIPVPSRNTSPQLIPSGPAVFTLRAKVSTPSSLGGKSLSTIESADTGRIEQDVDTNTVMRPGPQRRPTISRTVQEFKHLSADTDADPTTISAQTESSMLRPSSRTESLLWVETENDDGIRTKRLSSGEPSGLASDYGPRLTISPDADELIMGRKTTPSPPILPVGTASGRSSGHRSRDLHRMAVTNELRKVSGQACWNNGFRAKLRTTAPDYTLRRQSSASSIQAENFTVKRPRSSDSLPHISAEPPRLPSSSWIEQNFPDPKERLAAVSQTLAMLEGDYRDGAENPQLEQGAALARTFMGKSQKSPASVRSSTVFTSGQNHRSGSGLIRSDSSHSTASSKRTTGLSRGAVNMKRSSSVVSVASSRPRVPAKDYRPASKAPSKDPSIKKRNSSGRFGTAGLRSPYGLANGYSATPSNIPQPMSGCGSSARLSSAQAMTDTSRSVSGEKRSVSKAKLTMSGFRGFFHKRSDLKISSKAGDKKKRSNTKVSSAGSPMSDAGRMSGHRIMKASSSRRSPGRSGTLTKAHHKHPAEFVAASPPPETAYDSEITQVTTLAMHITTMARGQEDDSKKHQLLSVATAMLGAIDSAKHAKIAAEQAAQAAREASMHQEMTRQSLIAINKVLTSAPGLINTLSRSYTSLRQRNSRPSTMAR